MSFDLAGLKRAVARHGTVARVVVARAEGSAPREPGAAMLVWASGQEGTIGGGALEWEAAARAREVLGGRDMVLNLPLGPALGQCCGGAVTLVIERYDAARLAGLGGEVVVRRVSGRGEMPLNMRKAMGLARSCGQPPEMLFTGGWLLEPIAPPRQALWIHGAGHVGRALVSVLAPLPGFEITWLDTAAQRFPEEITPRVHRLVAANPAEAVKHAPADAGHLVVTYSHALDLEICHRLLGHGFAYAGLIGSRSKWARFRSRLRQLGHGEASISRIECPIGMPELGKHPQAIAVGVAATLLSPARAAEIRGDKTG